MKRAVDRGTPSLHEIYKWAVDEEIAICAWARYFRAELLPRNAAFLEVDMGGLPQTSQA